MTAHARPRKFPRVPYIGIRWIIGQLHVSAEPLDIIADMDKRCRKAGATEAETRETIRYALAVHEENRALYRAVMSGI